MLVGTCLTMTMRLAKKGRDGPAFMANSPILICPWVFQGGKDPKTFPQQNWAATGHWEWGARGLPNGEQVVYPVGNKRSTQQGANGLPKGVLCRQGEQGQKFQQQGRGGVFFLPFQERFQLNQQWDGTHVVIYCKPITSAWFNPLLILQTSFKQFSVAQLNFYSSSFPAHIRWAPTQGSPRQGGGRGGLRGIRTSRGSQGQHGFALHLISSSGSTRSMRCVFHVPIHPSLLSNVASCALRPALLCAHSGRVENLIFS